MTTEWLHPIKWSLDSGQLTWVIVIYVAFALALVVAVIVDKRR